MATTLAVNPIRVQVGWAFESTTSFGTNTTNNAGFSYSTSLANGTGAGAAQKLYAATVTQVGGNTTNYDLAAGLTDLFGTSITFARFKVLYVHLTTTTTATSIKVGGHATAAVGNWITSADTLDNDQPAVRVRNGGILFLACTDATGYVVTATTDDLLTIVNEDGSNTATINLLIVGE